MSDPSWSLAHSGEADFSASSQPYGSSSSSSSSEGGWSHWEQADETFLSPDPRTKDAVIFLVDVTAPMFSRNASQELHFHNAIQCIELFTRSKIIQSTSDLLGLCLFGTSILQSNNNALPHIHKYLPLTEPSASTIRAIQALASDTTVNSIGVGREADADLSNALWACASMFNESATAKSSLSSANKRILIFTTNDFSGITSDERSRILLKGKDLKDSHTELLLFPFQQVDKKFNFSALWRDLAYEDESYDVIPRVIAENFAELKEQIYQKIHKKRSLGSIPFSLSPALQLSVKIFVLYLEAKKEPPITLSKEKNIPLESETKQFDTSTGEQVLKHQIRKYHLFGGKKAYLTDAELKSLKSAGEAGLTLLGFKSRSKLHVWHNIRSPYFIYPNELTVKGSTRAFSALLSAMDELHQIAICRLSYRAGSIPRLVALLPQKEKLDSKGKIDVPPGLHCVFLPYADDIRPLELSTSQAVEDDVKVHAKKIIARLKIDKFDPSFISNPALYRHYAVIEAMALMGKLPGEDGGEEEEGMVDDLQPDRENMRKSKDLFDAFNAAVGFGQGGGAGAGTKRRGGGADSRRVKKEVPDEEYERFDWENLKKTGDDWKKMKVDELKIYLRRHGLPLSGKKDELILRIEQHHVT